MHPVAVDMSNRKLCVGVIVGAHGVRGDVRVKSFTVVPEDLASYGRLADSSGRREFTLSVLGQVKGLLRAHIAGVDDRNAAEALAGVELHIDRDALPGLGEEEFYHSDLIGLSAEREDGSVLGTIAAVHDFGAGDVIEIAPPSGGTLVLPFTAAVVPVVDLAGGRVVIRPPVEVEARPGDNDTGGGA